MTIRNLTRLIKLFDRFPQLRLMQMIVNAGLHERSISGDSYYLTDDDLLDKLEAFYKDK